MNNLAARIAGIPETDFPDYFNVQDCKLIAASLEAVKQKIRPYEGKYEASWLLTDFHSTEWITTNRGREEKFNGKWKNAVQINWEMRLPNSELLTSLKYRKFLDLNRRIAFLIRNGHTGEITTPQGWKAIVSVQLALSYWMVLHEKSMHPSVYGFKLLDQAGLASLLCAFAEGGWSSVQQIPQRLLSSLYQKAFKAACPSHIYDSIYTVPEEVKQKLMEWMRSNGFYEKSARGQNRGKHYLRRDSLARLIDFPTASMRAASKLHAFFRQFEPDFSDTPLLINVFQETEKPDQKTRMLSEIANSNYAENSINSLSSALGIILSAYRHCSDLMPEPSLISINEASRLAKKSSRSSRHNLFIPINTGLTYLNQAMKFVHLYGNTIVEYHLAVQRTAELRENHKVGLLQALDMACEKLASEYRIEHEGQFIPISEVLGIKGFKKKDAIHYPTFREHPSLDEVLRVLIGACVICISLLKPSRKDEITHLKRDCIRQNPDGYYLHFHLGKSNTMEAYQDIDKPIPKITATAIHLLQKLGSGCKDITGGNRKIADNLFFLPKIIGEGGMVADSSLLNRHLDIFCDYAGLPTDDLGRRWYVRIHEMRKWFLLLLFWSGRFEVLDAARWIAGHKDARHIYAYIEREFPGEDLPKLEAQYAAERLLALDGSGRNAHEKESGLDSLYRLVLRHFQVESLAMIPESEWFDYVSTLREANGFTLEPHSIYDKNNSDVAGISVSFILREFQQ